LIHEHELGFQGEVFFGPGAEGAVGLLVAALDDKGTRLAALVWQQRFGIMETHCCPNVLTEQG